MTVTQDGLKLLRRRLQATVRIFDLIIAAVEESKGAPDPVEQAVSREVVVVLKAALVEMWDSLRDPLTPVYTEVEMQTLVAALSDLRTSIELLARNTGLALQGAVVEDESGAAVVRLTTAQQTQLTNEMTRLFARAKASIAAMP